MIFEFTLVPHDGGAIRNLGVHRARAIRFTPLNGEYLADPYILGAGAMISRSLHRYLKSK